MGGFIYQVYTSYIPGICHYSMGVVWEWYRKNPYRSGIGNVSQWYGENTYRSGMGNVWEWYGSGCQDALSLSRCTHVHNSPITL